eukprot:COSAG01_NODE_3588_length_5905_cov_3.425594_9_plen_84_part_00
MSSLRAAEMDAIKSELQSWHERAISAEDELEKLRDNAGQQQQTNATAVRNLLPRLRGTFAAGMATVLRMVSCRTHLLERSWQS